MIVLVDSKMSDMITHTLTHSKVSVNITPHHMTFYLAEIIIIVLVTGKFNTK